MEITINAVELLDETRERLHRRLEGRGQLAQFDSTEHQLAGVMHFLGDLLVENGMDRTEVSENHGWARLNSDLGNHRV